jgi:hypothetical protein
MPDTQRKTMTLRLPAIVARARVRGARWWAWPLLDDTAAQEQLGVYATSEALARRALAEHIPIVLRRACDRPVLVIGGGPGYADCAHVINPEPSGWVVYIIRGGRESGSWHTGHDRDTLLAQVLGHVGGAPHVVAL